MPKEHKSAQEISQEQQTAARQFLYSLVDYPSYEDRTMFQALSKYFIGTPEWILRSVNFNKQTYEFGFGFSQYTTDNANPHAVFSFLELPFTLDAWTEQTVAVRETSTHALSPLQLVPTVNITALQTKLLAVIFSPQLSYTREPSIQPKEDLRVTSGSTFFIGQDAVTHFRLPIYERLKKLATYLYEPGKVAPLTHPLHLTLQHFR